MKHDADTDRRTDTDHPADRYMTPVPPEERPQATVPIGEILCPVPGCGYSHESAQGLCGHIPNKGEPRHRWSAVDVTAADLKELDSRGTHPDPDVHRLLGRGEGGHNPRKGTEAYLETETVRAHLTWEGVPLDDVQVFYDAGYGSVQIQPRRWLPSEEWDRFLTVMYETDGVRRAGDTRFYCRSEFVEELDPYELGVNLSGGHE